jgi:hypothetical protein
MTLNEIQMNVQEEIENAWNTTVGDRERINIMEKLCIYCKNLEYEGAGTGDYAEPASLYCKKKHKFLSSAAGFCHSQFIYDIEDFRRMIKTAENCADYKTLT